MVTFNVRVLVVYGIAAVLLLLPFLFAIDVNPFHLQVRTYRLTLDSRAFFVFMALLPGILGVVYHLVTVRQRRDQNRKQIAAYYAYRDHRRGRAHESGVTLAEDVTRGPVSANAASTLLTAVFLFVALYTGYNAEANVVRAGGIQGMLYAGIGAYMAVLYAMVPRIYASALSSRFLMMSALRSASAVVLGFVLGTAGGVLTNASQPTTATLSLIFLSGLFHNHAIDALRQRARTLFGAAEPEAAEVPIAIIEGVDDTAADLLMEYGVTSVQHLATAEPGDLCERTLLPMDRVLDWMDQAILVSSLKRGIAAARSIGIRGATGLAEIADKKDLLNTLAEKLSMPIAAVENLARDYFNDYTVRLIYVLREGHEIGTDTPDQLVDAVVQSISNGYNIVGLADANPIGKLEVKPSVAGVSQ